MTRRRRTQRGRGTEPDGSVQAPLPKAIGYGRVSTEEQARKGVSLDAQRERIVSYCLASGLDLRHVILDDGVSGAKKLETRPGGIELAEAVENGPITHVVAMKLDRLFRDAEDALHRTRAWDRAGIALHIIDMGGSSLNTASAMGRMFVTMTAAFAELERNLISERTAIALRHKRDQRKVYAPTPFGFDRSGDTLVENDSERATLRLLRQWDAEGLPYRAMADRLNAAGTPTKRGGKCWYASTVLSILSSSELHG